MGTLIAILAAVVLLLGVLIILEKKKKNYGRASLLVMLNIGYTWICGLLLLAVAFIRVGIMDKAVPTTLWILMFTNFGLVIVYRECYLQAVKNVAEVDVEEASEKNEEREN